MPEVSRFFGIVIRIFFDDHPPPHFHASYGEYEARIEIQTLTLFAGYLPPRALGLVIEWATLHQSELLDNWNRTQAQQSPVKIAPLQ